MKNSTKWFIIALSAVLLIVLITTFVLLGTNRNDTKVSITEIYDKINQQGIERVEVSGYQIRAYEHGQKNPSYYAFISSRSAVEEHILTLNDNLVTNGGKAVQLSFDDPNANSWMSYLWPALALVVLVVLFIVMMRQMNGGGTKAMSFAKSKARINENIKVRFTDVAGADEEKDELKEIVEFLKTPKKFSELGARIPKGVLLVGPPGTGKTLFAKAVAGEANVPFFSISGSDFVEMFVGVGASRVRDLFEMAKKSQPCIIFIDEIDAVGRQRGTGLGGGHDEREQTLNQLLVQMDGFESNESIIVMAATNRADILDPALMRPGRFDRQIYVNPPDVRGREAIFRVHTRNKPMATDINYKHLARITAGFTGADIANLLNEAAILAARENRKYITMKDVNEGINKVIMGPQKKSRLVTETDKRITAYHEAGHAIIARELPHCDPPHEVSIIPRGNAAGYTMTRPDNDDNHMTKSKLMDSIAMMLGGRVAEELVIKDISTGAENDLQRTSQVARSMVAEWGMSDLGPIYLGGDQEVFLGRDYTAHNTYSEAMAAKVDSEISRFIKEGHDAATTILQKHLKELHGMARLLVERETIYSDEIDMLFEGKTVDEVIRSAEERDAKTEAESKRSDNDPRLLAKATFVKPAEPFAEAAPAPEKPDDKKNDDGDNSGGEIQH